jgi:hypothetical protein
MLQQSLHFGKCFIVFLRLSAVLAFALLSGIAPSVTLAQAAPAAAPAQPRPTQAQVQAALSAANVDLRQKRKLKPMMETYKSQIANAPNDQAKTNATQQLIASMKTVLSPAQQGAFKQSLENQMAAGAH